MKQATIYTEATWILRNPNDNNGLKIAATIDDGIITDIAFFNMEYDEDDKFNEYGQPMLIDADIFILAEPLFDENVFIQSHMPVIDMPHSIIDLPNIEFDTNTDKFQDFINEDGHGIRIYFTYENAHLIELKLVLIYEDEGVVKFHRGGKSFSRMTESPEMEWFTIEGHELKAIFPILTYIYKAIK